MTKITLKNIQKNFAEKNVLNNFSMTVHQGEYLAITGPSGKGKTTLLNIIGMLEKVDSGDISFDAIKNPTFSSKASLRLRRKEISYLFQNYGLIDNDSVEKNLLLPLKFKKISKQEKRQKISSALTQVGLKNFEKRKVFTLSGGEQQRVALAKIVLKDPAIILADEPTGSLDEQNRDEVLSLLNELHERGKTIIVVTHDSDVADRAQRVLTV
ncbi:ABC transporter ATP-binding protein [Enterococcus olivae]